jgi:glycosyltransferase involved in cell wall biosynthesis
VKILVVTFTYPPELGGVAEVARTQVNGFVRRGHEVSVATTYDARRTTEHAPAGVKIHQFRVSGSFQAGRGYHGEVAEYRKFLAHHPADVVLFHCWQAWPTDTAVPVLKDVPGKKVLISHGFDAQIWKLRSRPPWGLGVWLRSLPYVRRLPKMMAAFDRLIFLSDQQDLGRFYDRRIAQRTCRDLVSVIPNGVHLAEFSRSRESFRQTHNIQTRYLVLHVANYDDRKNQLATLQDFMAANRPDATLVFIGGEFNAYQARVAAAHTELHQRFPQANIRFLQKIPKDSIYAAYQAADVFLLGAKYETQPLAILDAMAAGVPFISTNTGCVSEFPGGLVHPSGPATTTAINQLLNHEEFRKSLGAQGRAACEAKYDWERVLDAYEKLLAELVQTKQSI